MQVEVGSICEGKVTGITKFGAFVDLGDGKTGMVHISEVAPTYVSEIKEYLHRDQVVKVKVIGINEEGKISLSIKKAMPKQEVQQSNVRQDYNRNNNNSRSDNNRNDKFRRNRSYNNRGSYPSKTGKNIDSFEWSSSPKNSMNFEDMMSKFKQSSEDKMSDLKKTIDTKRGGTNRKSKI